MKIPQFEPVITDADKSRVADQVASGWLGPGEAVNELERRFVDMTGHDFAIATTSGTTALHLALAAISRDMQNQTVLFPAYTHIAGAHAAYALGMHVKQVDVDPETLCMRIDHVQRIFEQEPIGALIFVDHNGYAGLDRQIIKSLCETHEVILVEDAAQGVGCFGTGAVGDISTFSFSVPKIVTSGQGGMIVTSNPSWARGIRQGIDQGGDWRATRVFKRPGLNMRFTDIQASLLLSQLDRLPQIRARRKQCWDRYSSKINIFRYNQDITWMAIYRAKAPATVMEALRKEGIGCAQYYQPINTSPHFHVKWDFPNANLAAAELIYLPSSHNLTDWQIDLITDIIKETDLP